MEHPFDRLTKALAQEMPRREALRHLGGGLATALLASLGLPTAWGQGSNCQSYCRALVGSPKAFATCVISCEDCLQGDGTLCGVSAGGAVTCCGPGLTCIRGECRTLAAALCGTKVCGADEKCCLALGFAKDFSACCLPEEVCCAPGSAVCCPQGTTCCQANGNLGQFPTVCCREDETCCRGGTDVTCCPTGTHCLVGQCLPARS
jgi:hypothetical protein